MKKKTKNKDISRDLQSLMNIGPAIAGRLCSIGITAPSQIKKSDPEKIYEKLKKNEGGVLDRCVLYALRGAVSGIPWWACKDSKAKGGSR